MKDAQHHYTLGEYKLKPRGTTTHLFKHKIKNIDYTKYWWGYGQLELSYVVGENIKCYYPFGKHFISMLKC